MTATEPNFTDPSATPQSTGTDETSDLSSPVAPATSASAAKEPTPAPGGYKVGDVVTLTTQAPWGEQTQTGRVVAVGTPDGADDPQVQVEWITITGPIDASRVEAYEPTV